MKYSFCYEPSVEEVRECAYSLYLASGCQSGRDMDNWLAAELEVRRARSLPLPEAEEVPGVLHFPPSARVQRPAATTRFPFTH